MDRKLHKIQDEGACVLVDLLLLMVLLALPDLLSHHGVLSLLIVAGEALDLVIRNADQSIRERLIKTATTL